MIGDVLTTSILFEAIKHKYPHAELHYLINSHTFPVVENNSFIDNFIFFTPEHEKSSLKVFKLGWNLRQQNYDVVIDVYSKLSSNLISLLSKAKFKISLDKGFNKFIYDYRYKSKDCAETNAGLAIENRLQLLKPINIDDSKIYRPKIYLTDSEKINAKKLLKNSKIDLNQSIVMISVLGSCAEKTYPHRYMAQVIDLITNQSPNIQILFNYTPNQLKEAEQIYNLCHLKSQIHFDIFGKKLSEFLAITSHCIAVIGNEGGVINMAKALKIPTYAIFSPWIEKEVWNMFDDGKNHISVHLKDFEPEIYKNVDRYKDLKQEAKLLYENLKPDHFFNSLEKFIANFS